MQDINGIVVARKQHKMVVTNKSKEGSHASLTPKLNHFFNSSLHVAVEDGDSGDVRAMNLQKEKKDNVPEKPLFYRSPRTRNRHHPIKSSLFNRLNTRTDISGKIFIFLILPSFLY